MEFSRDDLIELYRNMALTRVYDEQAVDELMWQADQIVAELKASGIEIDATKEMVAMIAYLHKLGRDIEPNTNQKPESHENGE